MNFRAGEEGKDVRDAEPAYVRAAVWRSSKWNVEQGAIADFHSCNYCSSALLFIQVCVYVCVCLTFNVLNIVIRK